MLRPSIASFLLALLLISSASLASGSKSSSAKQASASRHTGIGAAEAQAAVEADRARRLAQSSVNVEVAPFWRTGPGADTQLYLANSFGEILDVEIQVLDAKGRLLAAHVLAIDPARHQTLSLRDLLGPRNGVRRGSLRVRYVGDDDMLMAWTVLTDSDGTVEVPLKNMTADTERTLTT